MTQSATSPSPHSRLGRRRELEVGRELQLGLDRAELASVMVDLREGGCGLGVGAVVGAVVGAGAGLMVAFAASGTVTRLEPISFGVVSFTFGPMMGLLENLKKLRTLVGFAYLGKTCSKI